MKTIKTFIISQFQIAHLRSLLLANGETDEAEKLSGSDLAFRWKCINITDPTIIKFPKSKVEQFTKMYPYFAFDISTIVKPVVEKPAKVETTPEATEMKTPEASAPKGKNKKAPVTTEA